MSLAPPQTRSRNQDPRLSSVLPGVTCSSCAAQIQLGRLGEHVCRRNESTSSHHANVQPRPRPQRQTSSKSQQSQQSRYPQHAQANHSSLSTSGQSALSSRVPTSLKIDLGTMSNWPGEKQQQQGQGKGGEAGIAGVGRRGFGLDLDGAPSPTFLHPPKAQTPPHAYMSSAPTHSHIDVQNQHSPYFIAAQASSPMTLLSEHYVGTSIPARTPSSLASASRPGAASSVSISISSPDSRSDPQRTHHRPPGSWNSSLDQAMVSPPVVPQTASSDATIPYTIFSSESQYALSTGKDKEGQLLRTTSSTKGKGVAYPRPSVSPAEYTQQQRQLGRHTPSISTPASASASHGKLSATITEHEKEKHVRFQAGQRGPLKVVNTTPRPESITAFQKQGKEDSLRAGGADRVKKVTGFALENQSRVVGSGSRENDAVHAMDEGRDIANVQEGSRWNVLRSALRRGMSYEEKPGTLDSATSSDDDYKPTPVSSAVMEDQASTPGAGSPAKLQFLERYKRMADAHAADPGVMPPSLWNNSSTSAEGPVIQQGTETDRTTGHPLDVRVRAGMLESLVEEPVFTQRPADFRVEEAYMNDDDPGAFWSSRHGESQTTTPRRTQAGLGGKTTNAGLHSLSNGSTRGGKLHVNESISSIDSIQAGRIRMGEDDLLTPSTSMDRLAEIARGPKRGMGTAQPSTSWDNELDPVEGLVDKPTAGSPIDSRFDHTLSPNLSQATSRQSYLRRGSTASSLLAPSDSISTPGVTDKFHIEYNIPIAVREKPKPGSKACQRCGQSLMGKRFIERDGMLLCERDWKELFLPKCRRCEKPIETSAVSSKDGQLKGKWHRACFSCYRCSQPFDGDSFYVHDDKPYCQLHYHEANGSLCASQQCGQPIEGPCLLTADNQRYHPGHLACDYGSGHQPCGDPMIDYYEIGTLKVCEAHKDSALTDTIKRSRRGRSSGMTAKAEKRRTRLIDGK